MPRTCSLCKSQRRSEIEAELIRGEAYRGIAKQYGCSPSAVFRHKNGHLPEKLTLAKRHQETLSAEGLLAEMAELNSRLRNGLDQAERAGNMAAFVAFAREHRQCLESYFEMADRIANKVRLTTDGLRLAERIAAARKRVANMRETRGMDVTLESAKRPAKALEPAAPVNPPSPDVPVKPQQPTAPVREYDDWVDRLVRHSR
jgi:hypothetical protein